MSIETTVMAELAKPYGPRVLAEIDEVLRRSGFTLEVVAPTDSTSTHFLLRRTSDGAAWATSMKLGEGNPALRGY